ncbi:MAG: hypothetical protein F6K10_08150 [Moorea sp. SIO2B7]|nr:hypothetical protein [Moorena sp. SIO2B7]
MVYFSILHNIKQNPSTLLWLTVRRTGKAQYHADYGNYIYQVSPNRVNVFVNGR